MGKGHQALKTFGVKVVDRLVVNQLSHRLGRFGVGQTHGKRPDGNVVRAPGIKSDRCYRNPRTVVRDRSVERTAIEFPKHARRPLHTDGPSKYARVAHGTRRAGYCDEKSIEQSDGGGFVLELDTEQRRILAECPHFERHRPCRVHHCDRCALRVDCQHIHVLPCSAATEQHAVVTAVHLNHSVRRADDDRRLTGAECHPVGSQTEAHPPDRRAVGRVNQPQHRADSNGERATLA